MFAVTAGVFVTAFYSFRMYFLVFHGEERFHHKPFPGEHDHHDDHGHGHAHTPHESPWVVTAPLLLLAMPSVVIGYLTIRPMLYGDFFKDAIFVDAARHPAMAELAQDLPRRRCDGAARPADAAVLAGAGRRRHGLVVLPEGAGDPGRHRPRAEAGAHRAREQVLLRLVQRDACWPPARALLGTGLWKGGDQAVIDGVLVNGSARAVGLLSGVVRLVQTGHLYWYALVMLLGIFGFMTWRLWPFLGGLLR